MGVECVVLGFGRCWEWEEASLLQLPIEFYNGGGSEVLLLLEVEAFSFLGRKEGLKKKK